ncbi:hypothetical protein [Candidatus Uabimicrobium sp. HlEnr_7]|uniref:hypothetical protein n=1 Tax=Candidatus Uabimicrobium helgolandensis TaxID=3095367 RepID=UPI0035574A0E
MFFSVDYEEEIEVDPPRSKKKSRPVRKLRKVKFIHASGDISCPIILTSDLHENANVLIETIANQVEYPEEWVFISGGDMAGEGVMGSDGDITPVMEKALKYFGKVFFVKGNCN